MPRAAVERIELASWQRAPPATAHQGSFASVKERTARLDCIPGLKLDAYRLRHLRLASILLPSSLRRYLVVTAKLLWSRNRDTSSIDSPASRRSFAAITALTPSISLTTGRNGACAGASVSVWTASAPTFPAMSPTVLSARLHERSERCHVGDRMWLETRVEERFDDRKHYHLHHRTRDRSRKVQ